jgi:hypothetical protein
VSLGSVATRTLLRAVDRGLVRGILLLVGLYLRHPYPMLCLWVYRGLRAVDTEAAGWWFRVSGLQASADRSREQLKKFSA